MGKYSDFNFTEDDEKALIDARKKICEYIENVIIPGTDCDLRVDYGDKKNALNNSSKDTTEFHFYVYKSQKHFLADTSCGIKERFVSIGYSNMFGHIKDFETATFPYDIIPVVDNWKHIRNELILQINKAKRVKYHIHNFEV